MVRFGGNRISMSKPDFRLAFNQNERSVDGMLVVMVRPNGLAASRLGLSIAKKHVPGAVERNRVKRLVRESFMHHQPFAVPVDAVVMSCPSVELKSNQRIFQSLAMHWQKINNKLEQRSMHG